jgi:hypothetical protein
MTTVFVQIRQRKNTLQKQQDVRIWKWLRVAWYQQDRMYSVYVRQDCDYYKCNVSQVGMYGIHP